MGVARRREYIGLAAALVVIALITTGALGYISYASLSSFRRTGETIRRTSLQIGSLEWFPSTRVLALGIRVENGGSQDVRIDELRFSMYANDAFIATVPMAAFDEPIPPGGAAVLPVDLALTNHFAGILEAELAERSGTWSLRGTAVLRVVGIPTRFPLRITMRRPISE